MDDSVELLKLNSDTFKAEEGGETKIGNDRWDEFLRKVLANEFKIRRANHTLVDQDVEGMVGHINRSGPSESREILTKEVKLWVDGTLGVVASPLLFRGKKYQNIKVFNKQLDGHWLCVYWQVSEAPVDAG